MIKRGFSLYLDLWRIVAASIVFVYHSGELAGFSEGMISKALHLEDGRAAHLAVVIFFVLSGYLISYSISKPGLDWRKYFVDRAARMYSVVLPALLLTAITMGVLMIFDHQRYVNLTINGWQSARYAINLVFLQQIWFFCVVPGMLRPIWSLGYEFWYYVLLGIWVFIKRPIIKWSLLFLILLMVGPKIILLLGAWLTGVIAHRSPTSGVPKRLHKIVFTITLATTVCSIIFAAHIPFWNGNLATAPLYYSTNWLVDNLFAPFVALNLWSASVALPEMKAFAANRPIWVIIIRYFAGISFSLYLYHYPLFYLSGSFVSPPSRIGQELALILAVVVAVMVLARYTEQKLDFFRSATEYGIKFLIKLPNVGFKIAKRKYINNESS